MTKHTFPIETRTITGRKTKSLRNTGIVPANLFGKNIPSLNLQADIKQFQRAFDQVGESALLYLQVAGEKKDRPVFIRDVTIHPVTAQLQHVVFHQVDLKEKVTAPVPVVLEGEAPAEKEKLGIMVQQVNELEIESLPADMPENIKVDVSTLSQVGAVISVSAIRIPSAEFKILNDPDTIIVKIEPLAKEEKEEAPPPAEAPEGETPKAEVEATAPAAEPAPEEKPEE